MGPSQAPCGCLGRSSPCTRCCRPASSPAPRRSRTWWTPGWAGSPWGRSSPPRTGQGLPSKLWFVKGPCYLSPELTPWRSCPGWCSISCFENLFLLRIKLLLLTKKNVKPQTLVFLQLRLFKCLILSVFPLLKKTNLIPIVAHKVRRFVKTFMICCRCRCSGVCNLAMSWLLTDWWGRCHTDTLVTAWDGEDENITNVPGPDREGGQARKWQKRIDIDDWCSRIDQLTRWPLQNF